MAEEVPSYPPIEPTTFDLVVVGTGLPESIIAAAASAAGKSVLHLDPNPFYGSHFSSLSLPELTSFLHSHSTTSSTTTSTSDDSTSDYSAFNLTTCPLYSDVEVSPISPDLEHSRRFILDVSGPRVLFCADSAVDLMLKSGVSQYVEFKSIDASFIYDGNGNLSTVPDSRSAIFKDRSLGLTEKNQLMRFFKLVQEHLEAVASRESGEGEGGERRTIVDEDLETPFVEFLTKMRLPAKIKSIILYAIAMADYDQENMDACKDPLKTSDGINRLALYHSSVGRFNTSGAMLYPMYGQGELPQAFCRRAAVKGCLYVLRMPVAALLADKLSGIYKGIRLASGQDLFSQQLVLDPNFVVPQALAVSSPDASGDHIPRNIKGKVARGICIAKRSLKSDVSNLLVVYPPRSLYPEQVASIKVLQIGSNLAVCPPDTFIFYLSAWCVDAYQGKKLLNAAVTSLFALAVFGSSEKSSSGNPETISLTEGETEEAKPTLLWSALYIQEVIEGSCESICSALSPDGTLSYNALVDATLKMFHQMYPNEVFPETRENWNDDNNNADPES
ncbi:hypothetical protein Ancab_003082 [Ancistrocladus abbreviatus]